mmetsp:Transcript_14098/g.36493  ORF Transcript_14098/g.36493 Transcript_14098/m.36493 type:complete len:207 (-) Transcript_14098:1124-1744(-)
MRSTACSRRSNTLISCASARAAAQRLLCSAAPLAASTANASENPMRSSSIAFARTFDRQMRITCSKATESFAAIDVRSKTALMRFIMRLACVSAMLTSARKLARIALCCWQSSSCWSRNGCSSARTASTSAKRKSALRLRNLLRSFTVSNLRWASNSFLCTSCSDLRAWAAAVSSVRFRCSRSSASFPCTSRTSSRRIAAVLSCRQ